MIAVQKIVYYFLTLLLLGNTLLAYELTAQINQLSKNKTWHRFLHFKNYQSQIDDKNFFFSLYGKENPQAELNATIEKLISDKSDDENSTQCRYPSRSQWILEKIPKLKNQIFTPKCSKLHQEIKELNAKQITLVLASAHINSPASAFGHTFLRIDNNPNTPLLSYAINYAAQTKESNGFIYAYQGLFGGYKGRYSIDPYYKKLKEYSNLEQRDIWEYKLNLTQEEIDRLILHIFEIRHFYSDYFFLAENCSYNLLWLLEVAKPTLNLTNKFNHKAIPIDTLRVLFEEKLIKKTTYRPSKRKEILTLSQPIKYNHNALAFAKSNEYNLTELETLKKEEQIATLELSTALLQIELAHGEISKKEYLPKFLKLLKARSKLGKKTKIETTRPTPPTKGHLSSKIALTQTNKQTTQLHTKVAYHDIYDNDEGYIAGAFINFFDTSIEYKDNNLKLKELNLLDIKSYAIQDAIFKPISWEVALGAKRIFNNELNSYLKAGGGVTLGSQKFYGYATITPTLYYRKKEEHSISLNCGILYNPTLKIKAGLLYEHEWFHRNREIKRVKPFVTYSINQENALNIEYKRETVIENIDKNLLFSWFYYF